MLIDIIIILGVNIAIEWILEKLNQSKYEPFENIQANTRYIKYKKLWNYGILFAVISIIGILGIVSGMNRLAMDIAIGSAVAIVNTIFENTVFDQMRNTLR